MDTGVTRSHLYSACLLSATYYYEPGDNRPKCRATGFIAQYPSRKGWGLVTNRHIGDPIWKDPEKYEGTVLESLEAEIWITTDRRLKYELASIEPVFHDDPTVDVCVFPVEFHKPFNGSVVVYDAPLPDNFSTMTTDEQEKHLNALGVNYSAQKNSMNILPQHFLSWTFLEGSQQYWPVLDVGEMTFFPGYPSWFDKTQRRPVMRSGVIMSDPQTDTRVFDDGPRPGDGNHQMLFEAFSTDGNSGSPVYVAQRVPLIEATTGTYHPLIFVGINAGHLENAEQKHVGVSRLHKGQVVLDVLRKCDSLRKEQLEPGFRT
jgi:hypothetical protein